MKKENKEDLQIYGQQHYRKKGFGRVNQVFEVFSYLVGLLSGMRVALD